MFTPGKAKARGIFAMSTVGRAISRVWVLPFAALMAAGAAACGDGGGTPSASPTPAEMGTSPTPAPTAAPSPTLDATSPPGETPTDDASVDGAELTLQEYFRQVEAVFDQAGERLSAVQGEFDEAVTPDSTDEEVFEAYQEWLSGMATVTGDGIDAMEDIEPPAQAEEAHGEWLAAGAVIRGILEDWRDRFGDGGSTSELEELTAEMEGPEFARAGERGTEACRTLKGIADVNDVEVDLGC